MLIQCPECAGTVSDKAYACPHCGYPLKKVAQAPARIRKWKKLPNGYGSVKKLSGRRKKPYAAYPPVTEWNDNGTPKTRTAIGYFETYQQAYESLALYNQKPYNTDAKNITFAEVYEQYFTDKFVNNQKRKYSKSLMTAMRNAFNNLSSLHKMPFAKIKAQDMQRAIDSCPLKHASLEHMVNLLKQMYAFAIQNDYADKDYSRFVKINIEDDDEKGVPFTEEEIKILWEHTDRKDVRITLIMIYSGMRISELQTVKIDTENMCFIGGVKTKAGKNRTIPIHPAIQPYLGSIRNFKANHWRTYNWFPLMKKLGLETANNGAKHTPHDCRHTFSWLWDKYVLPRDDISKHLILGHSLGNDVEASVYAHRTIEELRNCISKIK